MGSWGTAIFSDDLAADVRGDWRDAILDGDDPAEITGKLVERHGRDSADPDETIVFWLALAGAQMETGRLDPAVRDRALAIIAGGGDLARWREQDPALARQRERVLARLAEKLRGPQAAPKRLRRTTPPGVSFDIGDAIRLRTDTRPPAVIAIVVADSDGWPRGTVNPVVELAIWEQERDPTASELAEPPVVVSEQERLRADLRTPIPRLFVVLTPTKQQRFGPQFGDIIARGVARSRPRNPRNSRSLRVSYVNWLGLMQYLGGLGFTRDLELTRRQHRPS